MLEKIKDSATKIVQNLNSHKADIEMARLEKRVKEARIEEERLKKEKNELEVERERLLNLSDKEMMVELIFAIRGFYMRLSELEKKYSSVVECIKNMESQISNLEVEINDVRSNTNNTY